MKIIKIMILLTALLLAGSAFIFQKAAQANVAAAIQATITPTVTLPAEPVTATVTAPVTDTAVATQTTINESIALLWEGDPLPDDNQDECRSLQIMVDGQAMIGPCGAVDTPVELSANRTDGWAAMVVRFAPFTAESEQGRVVFQGQGQISSPAWEEAIAGWAQFSYNELASGRVSASARTIASWWLGELPEQAGACRHLVVLSHGYAYSNITPCEGGNVESTIGGWLDTAEWDKFHGWLNTYAPLNQDNNYFTGRGSTEMAETEIAELADWSGDVYNRLRTEMPLVVSSTVTGTASISPTGAAGCPEPTAETLLLEKPEHGYCVLYPAEYTVEMPSDNATILVIGSLLNAEDPRLHIEVSEADERTLQEVADQIAADYGVPGLEVEQSVAQVGGEEAIVLDNLSGQDINRRLIFIHDNRLYNLMFAPASPDAGEVYDRMQDLFSLVLNSFTLTTQP